MIYMFTIICVAIYFLIRLVLSIGIFLNDRRQYIRQKNLDVSLIVAMRNEEHNVEDCLLSLLSQDYDSAHLEVIVVDDESEDRTYELAKRFADGRVGINVMRTDISSLSMDGKSYQGSKKQALQTGIACANGEIILLTDADCRPGPGWVRSMIACFDPDIGVVLGYSPNVSYHRSLTGKFAHVDSFNSALLAASGAGLGVFITCNGRNLAYRKILFKQVEGFSHVMKSVSGDDDLLIHEAMRHTAWQLHYCSKEESFVPSYNNFTLNQFFKRKIRHVSASACYPLRIKMFYVLNYILNSGIYLFIGVSFLLKAYHTPLFALVVMSKFLGDLCYFVVGNRFFKSSLTFLDILFYDVLQILYSLITLLFSRFKKITWS